jgi:hypothetical protein
MVGLTVKGLLAAAKISGKITAVRANQTTPEDGSVRTRNQDI